MTLFAILLVAAFALGLLFPKVVFHQVKTHHEYRQASKRHLKAVSRPPTNPSMRAFGG